LLAYSSGMVIQLLWQSAPGTSDSQFLMDLILDKDVDTRTSQPVARSIRDMSVLFSPIATTATPVLPFGGVASWNCGDRVFAWKIYTPDTGSAEALFSDAINRFMCGR
jgi:hypothetical protein